MPVIAKLFSVLPVLIAEAESKAGNAVEETILAIEDGAKRRSRVDTGQMRGGWTSGMEGPTEGVVWNSVQHTIFNEYGTAFMSAQPMLGPAVEEEMPKFIERMKGVYDV